MVSRRFGWYLAGLDCFGVVLGVSTDPTTSHQDSYDKNFVIIYSSIGVSYI